MHTTLLVEKNDQLQRFFSINLYTWVGSNVIAYSNAQSALEKIQNNANEIKLIISRAQIGTEQTAMAIASYLNENNIQIPLIIIGDHKVQSPQFFHIPSCLDIKELIQTSAKALGVTAKDMAQLVVPDYFPIPLQFFHCLKFSIVDIYINSINEDDVLIKDQEEERFELIFKTFEEFNPETIKKLSSEGRYELYVKKEDRLKFVNNLTQEIVASIEIKEFNSNEQVSAMEMTQKLLSQKMNRLGITEETVKLAQQNLKNMIATTRNTPILLRMLKRLINNKAGYLFKHTQVLMMVAGHLMQKMDWGTSEQMEKLQFICFFHDIVLATDEQAQISSDKELRESHLSKEDKNIVNKHAQLAATLVSKYPKAPMGSEIIIKQHHGVPHGQGFSEHYGANLSPMAIVFILAEDFTDEVLKTGLDFDIAKKISQMREKYTTQRFQKIIDALESVTLT